MKEQTEIQKLINHKPKAFAERFDIPLSTVQSWSSGKRNPPEYEVKLFKFAIGRDYKSYCFMPTNKEIAEIAKLEKEGFKYQQARATVALQRSLTKEIEK